MNSEPSQAPARRDVTRKTLRGLLDSSEVTILPGVYDGISARIVDFMGFDAALISGAGISNSRLGQPDVGLLSRDVNVDVCRRIASVVDLPLLADGETGYGNAADVFVATAEFEAAGMAGVFFEDQTSPKRCGHLSGKALISAEEMVMKVRAALEGRSSPGFVVMARTDAVTVNGLDDAIRRARLYLEAGADIVFPDAIGGRDAISRFVDEVGGPVCINMGLGLRGRQTTPLVDLASLQRMGVAMVMYPRLLTAAALRGMQRGLRALVEGFAPSQSIGSPDELVVPFEELMEILRYPEALERDRRYAHTLELGVLGGSEGGALEPGSNV